MDEAQWRRILQTDSSELTHTQQIDLINPLKRRTTFIKYKPNGRSYSRIYYLILSEDSIHYIGSKSPSKTEACAIKDIEQIRPGFTTATWKKCLSKRKISLDKAHLAFSILYNNNRHSLDLLAESEEIRLQWIQGLEYLIDRYRSHLRSHQEITDQWVWHLFSQADRDHSGHLTRQEIQHLLHILNIELTDNEIEYYFNQANIRSRNSQELVHLDKDEFTIFYKYISQRPELLKIICQFNGSTAEQMAATISEYSVIQRLSNLKFNPRARKTHSLSFRRPKNKGLSSSLRRRSASITPEQPVSSNAIQKKNYLTIEQLKDFLQKEQQIIPMSIEDCSRLIARFEPSIEGQRSEEIGVDGLRLLLLHDEFCIMDTNKTHRVYQDMTRPLTDYFIATSHNTYLQNNQLYGDCTPETYIHVLRTGCRAVEMDCYDGDDMEPIVYHGNTLTVPIHFQEVIQAIQTVAFEASPYPLFLNIENHCSYEQQGIMAKHLRDIFQDNLLTKPLQDDFTNLPSPEQLKYKVIIRSRRYPKGNIPADPKSNRSNDETEPNPSAYHPDFASLIIYSQIVSFTSLAHTLSTQKCFHSISFKESKANNLIQAEAPDHLDLLALAQNQLVRVYPGTLRQDSSNLHPVLYWTYGVQMVALNYQANDESVWLQQGLFSDNGGCGYVLKPPCLLAMDGSFDPKENCYEKGKRLQIHLISGQHLSKENDSIHHSDISDPFIKVFTYGIECDYTEHRSPAIRNNGLNPIWDYKISVDIYCPELCLIVFQVRDRDRYGSSAFLGQACLPFHTLRLGYRHIKLRDEQGDPIRGTLFVHISIDDF